MDIKIRQRDCRTVSELRIWTERARENYYKLHKEADSLTLTDRSILFLYSLIRISMLTEELSEDFRSSFPQIPWDRFGELHRLRSISDQRSVRYISSLFICQLDELDTHLGKISSQRFS